MSGTTIKPAFIVFFESGFDGLTIYMRYIQTKAKKEIRQKNIKSRQIWLYIFNLNMFLPFHLV